MLAQAQTTPPIAECCEGLHTLISYTIGVIIALVLAWFWFCYKDYRDYGKWSWFPF
jgi:hypothetical protein